MLVLIAALGVILLPVATVYWPKIAGVFGVVLLTGLCIAALIFGKTVFMNIIAVVLGVGAFLLGGMVAIIRHLSPDAR